jgi:hypothetical protein
VNTAESRTSTKETMEVSFNAKEILPDSKGTKSLKKLLEDIKKVARFLDLRSTFPDPYKQESKATTRTFECIDGSSRTYPDPHTANRSNASTSTHSEATSAQAVPNLEPSVNGTGFKAFGIEVCPNIERGFLFY